MLYAEIKKIADKIDGWLSERETRFLFAAAKRANKNGVIVEIGSWQGKSTTYLSYGSISGNKNKIYAIDPHEGSIEHKASQNIKSSLNKFKANIKKAKIDNIVIPIVKKSQDAAKGWNLPISFLWIDGDHSFVGAKSDFDLFSPFVVEGGIVAFHDATQGELPMVVCNSLRHSDYSHIGIADSIVYALKINNGHKKTKDYLVLFIIKNYHNFRKLKFLKIFKNRLKKIIAKV